MSAGDADRSDRMARRVDALVARFREIGETQMRDLPLYNDRLEVEAVGFQAWGEDWIGVLITPWFMNVVVLPGEKIAADMNAMGKPATVRLPAGETKFMWGGDEATGMFKALSLHSPMDIFVVQGQARAEAKQRLAKLLTPPAQDAATEAPETPARPMSRRELLRGRAG
ncbi:MAG: [NiFe]-hydrogenase assembly chaperone HybE [Alphaproteobacteria bacterium]|nr:[NiFe]-hydrogenase assembly chaperone HybE [Alphaproteobacteria bacterium]